MTIQSFSSDNNRPNSAHLDSKKKTPVLDSLIELVNVNSVTSLSKHHIGSKSDTPKSKDSELRDSIDRASKILLDSKDNFLTDLSKKYEDLFRGARESIQCNGQELTYLAFIGALKVDWLRKNVKVPEVLDFVNVVSVFSEEDYNDPSTIKNWQQSAARRIQVLSALKDDVIIDVPKEALDGILVGLDRYENPFNVNLYIKSMLPVAITTPAPYCMLPDFYEESLPVALRQFNAKFFNLVSGEYGNKFASSNFSSKSLLELFVKNPDLLDCPYFYKFVESGGLCGDLTERIENRRSMVYREETAFQRYRRELLSGDIYENKLAQVVIAGFFAGAATYIASRSLDYIFNRPETLSATSSIFLIISLVGIFDLKEVLVQTRKQEKQKKESLEFLNLLEGVGESSKFL